MRIVLSAIALMFAAAAVTTAPQAQIEREFNALFNVCVSSVSMLGSLQQTIEEQAKAFLSTRLVDGGLGQMFQARFPDSRSAGQALQALYEQASRLRVPPALTSAAPPCAPKGDGRRGGGSTTWWGLAPA